MNGALWVFCVSVQIFISSGSKLSMGKQEAFEIFIRDHEEHQTIEENTNIFKERWVTKGTRYSSHSVIWLLLAFKIPSDTVKLLTHFYFIFFVIVAPQSTHFGYFLNCSFPFIKFSVKNTWLLLLTRSDEARRLGEQLKEGRNRISEFSQHLQVLL